MPLFRGFSVIWKDFMIVFSFCQFITFYIKKKTLLSTNKLGTRYFMAVIVTIMIFLSSPLIN